MPEYRIRWSTAADVVATVEADDEETAYDTAVEIAKERLEQVAATINGVAVHADIDGLDAEDVTEASR